MLKNREEMEILMENGAAIARLCGEIDHHRAAELRRVLDDYIRRYQPHVLCLDASGVDFMDSSGLGLIMGRYNTMKEMGGSVTVADPTPATEKIMSLAGLERIVKILHTSLRVQKTQAEERAPSAVMSVGGQSGSAKKRHPINRAVRKEKEVKSNGKGKI